MSFVAKFFLLVTLVGFAELWLLVEVAAQLTFPGTLAVCILTGVVGGTLVRHQGLRTLAEVQRATMQGELPARQIVSGVVLLMVGATLILPGFVSDTVGFLLLVPPIRNWTARRLVNYFKGRLKVASFGGPQGFGLGGFGQQQGQYGDVIDVEPEPAEAEAEVIDVEPEPPVGDDDTDENSKVQKLGPGSS